MSFDPEKITFFAKTDARGQEVTFGIKAKDRQRHMYVVGKTGMGKSTLLENMAAQDIKNGEGMAFIDPHGSAAETLLEYVPEHRINDVIYFAPFDMDNPISFNVMEDVGPDKRHLVVSGLMSTFKKIWVDAWSARMEYILTNALLVLIEYPDTTLLSVNRLFSDKAYRKQVVEYCKDPAVKAFWTEEFANYTERFAAEALPSIQNKIGQFTGNPLIRNIIGQPHSSFDIRDIMDNKKILIMNLSKGLIGETNANLLGSMLTTRIYLAAMSRANLPVAEMKTMPNFYFYVDEFQSFANATFANILSEARKYHLNLIIAHQYIEQMEEEVRDAVFGNVGTTISFRVGPFDAEVLETVFTPRFLAADMVNLGFAQIYLTLMIDGIGSQPFSAVTLPPIAKPSVSTRDMVIASSRKNYTKPRGEVEKVVFDLHTPVKASPPAKKNNNNANGNSNGNGNDFKSKRDFVKKDSNFSASANKTSVVSVSTRRGNIEKDSQIEGKGNESSGDPVSQSVDTNDKKTSETKPSYSKNQDKKPFKNASDANGGFKNGGQKTEPRKKYKKTAEDLKTILGRISAEQNNNRQPKDARKNQNEENGKNGSESKSRSDLKSALANVLKDAESGSDLKQSSESKKDPETKKHSGDKVKSKADENISNSNKSEDEKKQHKEEIEKLTLEVESIFEELENSANNTSSEADISTEREDNFNNEPLSPKNIKKLFKHSGQEKTPFIS